jgi:hypothetical protein
VHCAVRVAADDDAGRERLVRYCARPPFALDRIDVLKDGRVTYLMKVPRRGRTHRVMTPVEFMARLAILVPPPYFPLVRHHGVLAARSSWRALVTPKPPANAKPKRPGACADTPTPPSPAPALPQPHARKDHATTPAPRRRPTSPLAAPAISPTSPAAADDADPTAITVKHWGRLLEGELFATSPRVEWSVLILDFAYPAPGAS